MHVYRALVDFRRRAPHGVQQLRARMHAARLFHEMFKQAKLGRPQMHLTRTAHDAMRFAIQLHVAK